MLFTALLYSAFELPAEEITPSTGVIDIKPILDQIMKYVHLIGNFTSENGLPLNDIAALFNQTIDFSKIGEIYKVFHDRESTLQTVIDFMNLTDEQYGTIKKYFPLFNKLLTEPFANCIEDMGIDIETYNQILASSQSIVRILSSGYDANFKALVELLGWKQLDIKTRLDKLLAQLGNPDTMKLTNLLDVFGYNYTALVVYAPKITTLLDDKTKKISAILDQLGLKSEQILKIMDDLYHMYCDPQTVSYNFMKDFFVHYQDFIVAGFEFGQEIFGDFFLSIFRPIYEQFAFEGFDIKTFGKTVQKTAVTLMAKDNQFLHDLEDFLGYPLDTFRDGLRTLNEQVLIPFLDTGFQVTTLLSQFLNVTEADIKKYWNYVNDCISGKINVFHLIDDFSHEISDYIQHVVKVIYKVADESAKVKDILQEISVNFGLNWTIFEESFDLYMKYLNELVSDKPISEIFGLSPTAISDLQSNLRTYQDKTLRSYVEDLINITWEHFTETVDPYLTIILEGNFIQLFEKISHLNFTGELLEPINNMLDTTNQILDTVNASFPQWNLTIADLKDYLQTGKDYINNDLQTKTILEIIGTIDQAVADKMKSIFDEVRIKLQNENTTIVEIYKAIPKEFWSVQKSVDNFLNLNGTTATIHDFMNILVSEPAEPVPFTLLEVGSATIETLLNFTVVFEKLTAINTLVVTDNLHLNTVLKEFGFDNYSAIAQNLNTMAASYDMEKSQTSIGSFISQLSGFTQDQITGFSSIVNNAIQHNNFNVDTAEEIIHYIDPTPVPTPSQFPPVATSPAGSSNKNNTVIIACSVVGSIVVVAIVVIVIFVFRNKKKSGKSMNKATLL